MVGRIIYIVKGPAFIIFVEKAWINYLACSGMDFKHYHMIDTCTTIRSVFEGETKVLTRRGKYLIYYYHIKLSLSLSLGEGGSGILFYLSNFVSIHVFKSL